MTDVRIIKKYPNRRLYDTEISRYITLEEVRQLVLQNIRFRVEDKRSHEDITRSILLQVIAEQEQGGDPIFTTDLLIFILRVYGDPMQGSISRYLELSIRLFWISKAISPSSYAACWAKLSNRCRCSKNSRTVRCPSGAACERNS